jgi:hypothetical protein
MIRFTCANALVFGVIFFLPAAAYSQGAFDPRAGPSIHGVDYWPARLGKFYAVKDDPTLLIATGYQATKGLMQYLSSSVTPAELVSFKNQLDTFAEFGVPSVTVVATGTYKGIPALLLPRYEGAAFDPTHDGTDTSAWIGNVNAEKTGASLDAIQKGVEAMEAKGYSVELHHFMIDKDGTVRVLCASVAPPPKSDGAGLGGGLPTVTTSVSREQQENRARLDALREGARLVFAAEKARLSRAEIETADRFAKGWPTTLDGGPALIPVDPRDGPEYDRFVQQITAEAPRSPDGTLREKAEALVRGYLALRDLRPEPGTSYTWREGLGFGRTGWTPVDTPDLFFIEPGRSYVWTGTFWKELPARSLGISHVLGGVNKKD